MKSGGDGCVEIHPRPLDYQKDGFTSWLRAEFVVANAIIDSLCHHLRSVGKPGEYDSVIGCVHQRRLSWHRVLHLQHFFPCTEMLHALQQVECNRIIQQQAIDQCKEGELGHDLRKSNDKGLLDVPNEQVDGSLETSSNPDGADKSQTDSRLKDVKVENISNYEGSCNLPVANNGLSIQNQNEENVTNSAKTYHVVETNGGNTVNMADRVNIYEEHLNQAKSSKIMSPVNDLRATGEHLQIPGYNEAKRIEISPTPATESRIKWRRDEDLHLVNAWLNTDKVIATTGKPKCFWERVADYYRNGRPDTMVERGPSHCKPRWNKITTAVHNFERCYEKASKQKTSEQAEDDVIRKANRLYLSNIGKEFLLEHAWRVLRSESKWRDTCLKLNATANTIEDSDAYLNITVVNDSMNSAKRMKINEARDEDNMGILEGRGKQVERECSDDSEGNLQRVTTKDEEYKMMIERDERKLKMQQEYLLVKKYDLLSNLVAQSGSLTDNEVLFKNKLVEDLLK